MSGPLGCYVDTDAKKSDEHILAISQAGLGLPDRDYYWDAKFKAKLAAYQAYIERMLTLAKIADAKQAAAEIVALETRIAKAQWSKVENRDVDKTYNKMGLAELAKLAPGFDWHALFPDDRREGRQGARRRAAVVLHGDGRVARQGPAGDLEGLAEAARSSIATRACSTRSWRTRTSPSTARPSAAFRRTVPAGSGRVAVVEGCLGEAVGKLYVEKRFPPEAKQRMDQMVKNVLEAYRISASRTWTG